jgi:hypothetical protein
VNKRITTFSIAKNYTTLGINDTKSLASSSSMSLCCVVAPNYLTFRQKQKQKQKYLFGLQRLDWEGFLSDQKIVKTSKMQLLKKTCFSRLIKKNWGSALKNRTFKNRRYSIWPKVNLLPVCTPGMG